MSTKGTEWFASDFTFIGGTVEINRLGRDDPPYGCELEPVCADNGPSWGNLTAYICLVFMAYMTKRWLSQSRRYVWKRGYFVWTSQSARVRSPCPCSYGSRLDKRLNNVEYCRRWRLTHGPQTKPKLCFCTQTCLRHRPYACALFRFF